MGPRHGLDLVWLWLWCRPAAVALIQPLAWDSPCAAGVALKSKAKQNKAYFTYKTKVLNLSYVINQGTQEAMCLLWFSWNSQPGVFDAKA